MLGYVQALPEFVPGQPRKGRDYTMLVINGFYHPVFGARTAGWDKTVAAYTKA